MTQNKKITNTISKCSLFNLKKKISKILKKA